MKEKRPFNKINEIYFNIYIFNLVIGISYNLLQQKRLFFILKEEMNHLIATGIFFSIHLLNGKDSSFYRNKLVLHQCLCKIKFKLQVVVKDLYSMLAVGVFINSIMMDNVQFNAY